MAEIRKLGVQDTDEALALDQFAFQFEIAPGDLENARRDSVPEDYYGSFVDGKLAAKLGLLALQTYVNGKVVPMGGVCGVASWPEYRRGGLVAGLIRHALRDMKENGQVVSYLAPFSFAFYRKYGYEHCIDRKQYTVDRADWPTYEATNGSIHRVEGYTEVAPIYEAYAGRYSGTLARSETWWEKRVKRSKPGLIAVYQNARGQSTGYMIYKVKGQEMTVHEFVFLDEEARRGLWSYIRNHDSMAAKATFIVPMDDPLPFLLPNPRIKQEIVPYFMARIVDVQPFLALFSFIAPVGDSSQLKIRVSDPNAPWNEGMYTLDLAPTHGAPVRVSFDAGVESVDDDGTLYCDIQTLTAMLFGYQRPSVLAQVGRLNGSQHAVAQWEQCIPMQTPFLYDFF